MQPAELCQHLRALRQPGSAALLIRVDFTDDAGWERVRDAVTAAVPQPGGEFRADLRVVNDVRFDGLKPKVLVEANRDLMLGFVAFLVDRSALRRPHPVVAVDLRTGKTVRVLPPHVWLIENNMSGGVGLDTLTEGRVVRNRLRPNATPLLAESPTSQPVEETKVRPSAQVTQRTPIPPRSFKQRRLEKMESIRQGFGGDPELERIAELVPGTEQLVELNLPLVQALLRLPREDQQRIAQWSRDKALDRAGVNDDPDIIEAITSLRMEWYSRHSTKELAAKFADWRDTDDGDDSTSTPGPYPAPRNVAMAAVSTVAAAVFPVPEVSVIRTLHAACSTYGPRAADLLKQLQEQFDIRL